jgi:tetratricopeptide (TPR) repeat protein
MEPSFEYEETDLKALVRRFERMLRMNDSLFFDVEEFEEIIDYYLEGLNTSKAKKAIDIAIAQHPGSSMFLLKQARYYMLSSMYSKSMETLDRLLDLTPNNHEIFLARGSVFIKMKRIDRAKHDFRLAIRYSDDKEETMTNIAFEFENAGYYKEALEYLEKALEKNPDNESIIYEISFCYEVSGNLKGAVKFFTQFLDKNPYSKLCWFSLGISYNNLDLYEKAIESYEFAIAIDDKFTSAFFNLGNSYSNLGVYHLAIKHYKTTFELEEPQAITYYYIGECYEKLEQYEMAIKNYHLALEIDEEIPDAWMGLGVCHGESGKHDIALDFMKKALELNDENSEFWYIYGDQCFKTGDKENALRAYHRVSQMDPMHPEIWLDLSELYDEQGDPEMANDTLEEGIRHQPSTASLYYRKAAYLLKLGREKQAISYLTVALETDLTKYRELLEYFPEAKQNNRVIITIEKHLGKKS